jgi:hypothetical protein
VNQQADGPGREPGPSEDIGGGNQRDVVSMLPHAGDGRVPAKLLRLPGHCGEYLRRRDLARGLPADEAALFGQPSNYSLSGAELAAHVRRLRQSGWQGWEVARRFDFRSVA